MESNSEAGLLAQPTASPAVAVRIFGLGNAGLAIIEHLLAGGLPPQAFVAVNTGPIPGSSAAACVQLESAPLRGLGTGGDPDRGRQLAEQHAPRFKALCEGMDVVFLVAGLGGGAGTGIAPLLAQIAKEAGALVLCFVLTPFDCEGSRRLKLAQHALEDLADTADGVVCLRNQQVLKLLAENASVLDAFRFTNELLADGLRGVWRLLQHKGLIEIHLDQLCALLRGQHTENAFAVAEAMGATRSREVLDKLLAHPLLEEGQMLAQACTILVSLVGGPDLTMTEVNRVMEGLGAKCGNAQVLMGAAIDEAYRERLAVTLFAARQSLVRSEREVVGHSKPEEFDTQLLSRAPGGRPGSRFVPPPPTLASEQLQQMLARQGQRGVRGRGPLPKLRQTQLQLEIVSKGRFDKSEPTIHKGEDLDVPTYIRRGVALN